MATDARDGAWLIGNVEIDGVIVDCRLRDGRIADIGADLVPRDGEGVIAGDGGALIPGLADHHIHVLALAAAMDSIDLGGADLPGRADPLTPDGASGWLRVIGAGRELVRTDIDQVWPERPVRVQHRSGAVWTLNTAAVDIIGSALSADERRTGQLWRADERLRLLIHDSSVAPATLPALGQRLASYGVTHLTDATPDINPDARALIEAAFPQHLLFLGDRTGTGPHKLIVADHEPPDLDGMITTVFHDHEHGRPVAIHAVTEAALALTIAALDAAGTIPGDRIEHAAVCSDAAAGRIAELGVTVVTQPGIATRNGVAYREQSAPHERALLWRIDGLIRAGVPVALSSDAPYGSANPWETVRSAADRTLVDGSILGEAEQIEPDVALASMQSDPLDPGRSARQVRVGAAADLCLLGDRLETVLQLAARSGQADVRATFVRGRLIYSAAPANGRTG